MINRIAGKRKPSLDRFFELAARQHHAMLTAQAAQANIRANAVHLPLVVAAGVCFAHLDDIPNLDFFWHDVLLSKSDAEIQAQPL